MTSAAGESVKPAIVESPLWRGRAHLFAVAMTTIAYGSASRLQTDISALAFSVLALVSALEPLVIRRIRSLRAASVIVALVLTGYAFVQTLPLPLNSPLVNPAWTGLADIIEIEHGFISVAPGSTREALPSLLLPFLAFASALAFFQGDEGSERLWRALAYFGAALALFGILQDVFLPEQLLFESKKFYVGSLTGTFVNRNTAGTFFGVGLALNVSLFFHDLKSISLRSLFEKAAHFDLHWGDRYARTVGKAALCALTAIALFLTQSRGAVGATFVAITTEAALFAMRPMTTDRTTATWNRWRRPAAMAGVIAATIGAFDVFAERSVYRMQEGGTEDSRWCAFASTWEAIRDNFYLGTGFGAFQDTFPMYRHSECAGIFGVWERAHNVYLEGLLGFGIVFLVALAAGLAILIAVLIHGVRARRRRRFLPVGGLAALALVCLHSLVDFSLQIPGFNVYFAAVMAAATTAALGR